MLNPSDVYVEGGSNNLLACWTDKVTKYDASSFYNWEQDNLPLHDLDERTELLWEKLGHPTSSITGMSFIVSGDATSSCNPLYFTTLSSCIEALPEFINYPILIEIASFGRLGGLNLSNKSFGPNGSLEIVNRNCGFASPLDLSANGFHRSEMDTTAHKTAYGLASAVVTNGNLVIASAVTSNSGSSVPILNYDIFRAKLFTKDSSNNDIFISSSVKGYQDERYDVSANKPYIFTRRIDPFKTSRLTAALESSISPWNTLAANIGGELSKFKFRAFDRTHTTEMSLYDVSTVNLLDGSEIAWGNTNDTTNNSEFSVAANAYYNSLDYVRVNGCNGPIYLRNLNVDARHERDRGIEISNSKVHLERCSASRANKAGVYAKDSEVVLLKGLVAYRNYDLNGTVRSGIPAADKRGNYGVLDSYGIGLHAVNSTVNLSSTYDRDISNYLNASSAGLYNAWSGTQNIGPSAFVPNPESENLYCFSRNDIGIHAINSNIFGGRTQIAGINAGDARRADANHLFSELNTEAGVKLDNSVFSHSGRLLLEGNYRGLDANTSKINIDSVTSRYNQDTAIRLSNSKFVYNKDLYANVAHSNVTFFENRAQSQVVGIENGQHIYCEDSMITPLYTSSMHSKYGMVYTSGCFGYDSFTQKIPPCIDITSNSDVDLIHAHLVNEPVGKTRTPHYGLLSKVDNNSTLTMRGSSEYANMVIGPQARLDNVDVAGIYANNESNVRVQGPTAMFRLGVDVLAENNSKIEFTPHQDNNGVFLVSSFDLSNAYNQTMVELHSTRACLVANKNSSLLMENLGDYYSNWLSSPYSSGVLINESFALDATETASYASAGYMQFYPNANTASLSAAPAGATHITLGGAGGYAFGKPGAGSMDADFLYTAPVFNITTGGMCVRALGNSVVEANNVNFPQTAFHNASSYAYDYIGTAPLPGPECSRYPIWNIADNSLLRASYLSVSGSHPRDTPFFGPSGEWGTTTGGTVSGAPSGTPHTSGLSVLDYYGRAPANPFGKKAAVNHGAFRLYFSTDPVVNLLTPEDEIMQGIPRQLFSQGYNFSGDLVASSTTYLDASSQYLSVFQRDENYNIQPSGFYYASAMVAGADSIKAFLEDSALNTFANAKHNMVGKSGLAKVVEGYYDNNGIGGDALNVYPYGNGLASVNNFDLKKDN